MCVFGSFHWHVYILVNILRGAGISIWIGGERMDKREYTDKLLSVMGEYSKASSRSYRRRNGIWAWFWKRVIWVRWCIWRGRDL